ncbi:MAG: NAD(P)/FAD-dependent oxidoreductase, partial [Rhodobacteraceae bacterium]|nr:NAD(P)/FAD-dependent oxidoreductase [Paracoccaceae bacterium]
MSQQEALVIGAGPAGLMAAQELAQAGLRVTIAEAMPSPGRKFLMAGKSGLNLTKDEPASQFASAYGASLPPALSAALADFGPKKVQAWAEALGQEVFTGSSKRVFPKAMKASPLLRAWLRALEAQGVQLNTRWRWTGWDEGGVTFDTPDGAQTL